MFHLCSLLGVLWFLVFWSLIHFEFIFKSSIYLFIFGCAGSSLLHFLWRSEWQSTPVFLPGEHHGQRSLGGYSTWGCKKLDTTEQLTHTHQWLRISLPMRTWVQSLLWEDCTCCGRLRPCTTTTDSALELTHCNYEDCALEPCSVREGTSMRSPHNQRKCSNEDPAQPNINK